MNLAQNGTEITVLATLRDTHIYSGFTFFHFIALSFRRILFFVAVVVVYVYVDFAFSSGEKRLVGCMLVTASFPFCLLLLLLHSSTCKFLGIIKSTFYSIAFEMQHSFNLKELFDGFARRLFFAASETKMTKILFLRQKQIAMIVHESISHIFFRAVYRHFSERLT